MRILSLCDYTGNMLKPWAEAGHECFAVDIAQDKPGVRDGIIYLTSNICDLNLEPGYFDLVFAFPPCTDLAASGARWWLSKGLSATIEALRLVDICRKLCEQATKGWMIENPVGRLSSAWRKPDHTFDPCDYGDPYTKKTCLWTGGAFVMPPKNRVEPTLGSKMHTMPASKDRQRLRSETPMGFARAVYEANK